MEMMLLMLQAFADISSIYVQKTAYATVRKSEVDLSHDGSSQLQFGLIQDQALATFCHGLSYFPESSQ